VNPTRPNTVKNLSLYMLDQALQMAIPVVTVPIFARLIAPAHYGVLDMLTLVMILGIGLGNWGLHASLERFYFDYAASRAKQIRLLETVVAFSGLCFLVVLAVILIFREPLAAWLTAADGWGWLMVLALASGFLNHLSTFFFRFFRNDEQALAYVKYDLVTLGVMTALSLYLVVVQGCGIWGLVLGPLVSRAVVLGLFFVRFRIVPLRIDWSILKECWLYGWPLMARVFTGVINTTVSKFMVGAMVSMAALGIFGRAQAVADAVWLLMTTVQNVYSPKWSRVLFGIDKGGAAALSALFVDYVAIIIGPAVLLVLFSGEIIGVLLPEPYRPAIPLIIGLALYYTLLTFGKLYSPVSAYLKMSKFDGACMFVSNLVNIGLNLVLIPALGAAGSVMATCAIGFAVTALGIVVYDHYYRIPFQKAKLAALYGGLFACAAAALVCYYGVVPYGEGLGLRVLLGIGYAAIWLKVVGVHRVRALVASLRRPTPSSIHPSEKEVVRENLP
jgi:O-antigen/teichoic acid export membrane protein